MNFLALAGEIRQLCAGGASGTLFVTTEDNHSVRIAVEGGNIVSLAAGQLKGAAVIDRLKASRSLRYRFQRDVVIRVPGDDDVPLAALDDEDAALLRPRTADTEIGSEVLDIIRDEAVECMGPMANMICTDHLQNVTTSEGMTAAIAAISSEMGDAALARQFQNRVQSRLREREI